MKKMLVIIAMFSFIVAGEMGLSAYGGVNMASISGDPGTGTTKSMKPGVILGVQYSLSPVILGAGISMRGSKSETTTSEATSNITMSFMYLDLSAIYPYALGPGRVWAGLDIGINLSAKSEGEMKVTGTTCAVMQALDLPCSETTSTDLEDVAMDYGLVLGYTYPINETMGVSASYYMGLAEITADSKSKHNGIGLGFSYSLPL